MPWAVHRCDYMRKHMPCYRNLDRCAMSDPPAHLGLRCGLGDDDGLSELRLQIHLVVSVPEQLSFDWGDRFAYRRESRSERIN